MSLNFNMVLRALGGMRKTISTKGTGLQALNKTQELFICWNSERLGISEQESRERFLSSWKAVRGGHAGADFRRFNVLSHDLLQVFFGDSEREVYDTYQFHSPVHFLRMLAYSCPPWNDSDFLVGHLLEKKSVRIVDYGCGLAQRSRALAEVLAAGGVGVKLTLVDIPTLRKDFLLWLGAKTGVETVCLDSTTATPIPELPETDLCFAIDFFEHVYHPEKYLEHIHSALATDGFLMADVADHKREFLHVTPSLRHLRQKISSLGFEEVVSGELFQKK